MTLGKKRRHIVRVLFEPILLRETDDLSDQTSNDLKILYCFNPEFQTALREETAVSYAIIMHYYFKNTSNASRGTENYPTS